MKCVKCGEELIAGDIFCTGCGTPVNQQVIVQQPIKFLPIEEKKKADNLCILSLLLYFAGPIACSILEAIVGILAKEAAVFFTILMFASRIAGIVLMVVARVKYPNSKFAKVLMWIYIALFILGFILIAIILILIFLAFSTLNY